jgi:hypothetical protein
MNKINRDKIAPQILDKIKEVNDEAGHRTYLEVPEMIRIICDVVEQNYHVIPVAWKAVEVLNNIHCFKTHKYTTITNGKCDACGILQNDVSLYSEYHHAMINL